MTVPLVSIVLPTLNGAATLPALLDALARQRTNFAFEVIAVDSSSSDGTAGMLRGRVDQLITIPRDSFDHGLTRNLGVERARGALVVLLVQDAEPLTESWLTTLTAPLLEDSGVAGAFCRQLPKANASPITRHYLEQWIASSRVARTVGIADRAELEALDPIAQAERCAFDNVCSCLRRSVWQQHPFHSTPIGEDIEWARDVLLDGYRIAYVPAAAVVHSHDRPARYEFARTYLLHQRLYALFRLRTIPSPALLVRAVASSLAVHLRYQKNARAVALAFAWPLGQYLGALSAIRGWTLLPPRRV